MPINKSQHFVPQHYLRQFRIAGTKQICVARIKPLLITGPASIRGQCQEDYFYSEDGQLDELLGQCEYDLGPILLRVSENLKFNEKELVALRLFVVVLHVRTRKSIEHYKVFPKRVFYEVVQDAINRGKLPQPPGGVWNPSMVGVSGIAGELMRLAMTTWLELQTLECKLLKSPENSYFITSDNPVVLLNQYFQAIHPDRNFAGFSRSGFQLILPISPKVCLLFYDPKIYKVGNARERVVVLPFNDVNIINSLQVQSAEFCLYFNDSKIGDAVWKIVQEYEHLRKDIGDSLKTYPGRTANEEIFHQQGPSVHLPSTWSFCRYRRNIKVGENNRRDVVWTEYIKEIAKSMEEHPEVGDVFDHMERVLGYKIKSE